VHVTVDQAGQHGLASQVDHLGARPTQLQHGSIAAYGRDLPARNGDRLQHRELGIDGDDLAVVQD